MFLGLGTIVQNLDVDILQSNVEITATLTSDQERLLEIFESGIDSSGSTFNHDHHRDENFSINV